VGYFGGTGAGRGWHQYRVYLLPTHLEEILRELDPTLVLGAILFPNREQPTVDGLVESYRAYVERCLTDSGVESRILFPPVSFTASMDAFREADVPLRRGVVTALKARRPLVSLTQTSIGYCDGKLVTNLGPGGDALPFGVSLVFPKVIFLDTEGFAEPHETDDDPNCQLFWDMKCRMDAVSKPCRIQSPTQVHRTGMRIAAELVPALNDSPMMKASQLSVV